MDTAEFSRECVRVRGTARHLQRLRSIERPFTASLTARANERQHTAALQLAVPVEVPPAIADPCSLTIQLMPVTQEFAFDLPLRIADLSLPAALRGRYRATPEWRAVRIRAGAALLSTLIAFENTERQQWASDHLRLLTWIAPREDSAAFGPELTVEARLEVQGPLRDRLDPVEFGLAEQVYRLLGMHLVYMNADDHDMHVAYVSHISHITSFALANTVLEKEKEEDAIFELASGGFESTVRLAKSNPAMWVPIFMQNKDKCVGCTE